MRMAIICAAALLVLSGCFKQYSNHRVVGAYEIDGKRYKVVQADYTTQAFSGSDLLLFGEKVTDFRSSSILARCEADIGIENCEKAFGAQLKEIGAVNTGMGDDY